MRNLISAVSLLGLGALISPGVRAETELEQALIEATVLKGAEVVPKPNMIVKVDHDGEINTSSKDGAGPHIGLKIRVGRDDSFHRTANVAAFVDGKKVSGGLVQFTKDSEATITFEGGGYLWKIRAARVSPELLERRRKELAQARR